MRFTDIFSWSFSLFVTLACSLAASGCETIANPELDTQAQELTIAALNPGKTKSGLSGEKDTWTVFQLNVPYGADELIVEIYGGTGDADLILRRDLPPTPTQFDFNLGRPGNSEFLNFAVPGGGTWYLALLGYDKFENVNLFADYHYYVSPDYLYSGVSSFDLAGSRDSWQFFRVNVPSGTSELRVESRNGMGSCNVFIKRGFKPTQFFYDEKTFGGGTWKNASITNPTPGLYYIGLQGGLGGYAGVSIRPRFN